MSDDDLFEWTNSDNERGEISAGLPRPAPDWAPTWERMVFMVSFESPTWLGLEDARRFIAWLSESVAAADAVLAQHPALADPDDGDPSSPPV